MVAMTLVPSSCSVSMCLMCLDRLCRLNTILSRGLSLVGTTEGSYFLRSSSIFTMRWIMDFTSVLMRSWSMNTSYCRESALCLMIRYSLS